jgi:hypothetical protein
MQQATEDIAITIRPYVNMRLRLVKENLDKAPGKMVERQGESAQIFAYGHRKNINVPSSKSTLTDLYLKTIMIYYHKSTTTPQQKPWLFILLSVRIITE